MPDPVMPAERWLPVVGWEGLYEVSDLGRVRSLPRRGKRRARTYGDGRVLKHYVGPGTRGYPTVGLSYGERRKNRLVHQLVLEAFVGPRLPGIDSRHGPAGKLDASLRNLCYGTRKENFADRLRDGTSNRGERAGPAKLTWDAVREIRRSVAAGESRKSAAQRFGVHKQTLRMIIIGKTWIEPDKPTKSGR
jgi:hypothetical protein